MFGNELVARDVDQQILLLEVFTNAAGNTIEQTHCRGRDGSLSDENSGMKIVLVHEMVECADLLRTHTGGIRAEFDVDGSAVGLRFGVRLAG